MKAVMAKHLLASSVPNPSLILVAQCKKLITLNFKPDFDPLKDRFLPRTAILRDFFVRNYRLLRSIQIDKALVLYQSP